MDGQWHICCCGRRIQCWPWLQLCDLFTGLSLWWSCVLLQCLQGVKLSQEGDGWGEDGVIIMVCWYLPHGEFGGLGISQLQEYWPILTCVLGTVLVNNQVLDAHTVAYRVLKVKVAWLMSLRTLKKSYFRKIVETQLSSLGCWYTKDWQSKPYISRGKTSLL